MVLGRFAHHVETGEAVPAELIQKLKASEEYGKGVDVIRQIFYARPQ